MKLPYKTCLCGLVDEIDDLYLAIENIFSHDERRDVKKDEHIEKGTILTISHRAQPTDDYREYFAYGAKNVPRGCFSIYNLIDYQKAIRPITKDEKYTILLAYAKYARKEISRMNKLAKKIMN
jgi:hypothetical protein